MVDKEAQAKIDWLLTKLFNELEDAQEDDLQTNSDYRVKCRPIWERWWVEFPALLKELGYRKLPQNRPELIKFARDYFEKIDHMPTDAWARLPKRVMGEHLEKMANILALIPDIEVISELRDKITELEKKLDDREIDLIEAKREERKAIQDSYQTISGDIVIPKKDWKLFKEKEE